MPKFSFALLAACAALLLPVRAAAPFELKDGDRVVFLGDTLIEREQHYGWIELMLTTRFPDRHVTFRNLGWSADTPAGESRLGLSLTQAGNEPEGEGWKMLVKQIEDARPTVVFVGYGMASSFDGEVGLPKFKADYNRLLDTIEKISPGVRLVLLLYGPTQVKYGPEDGRYAPQKNRINDSLTSYISAIRDIADQRKLLFFPVHTSPMDYGGGYWKYVGKEPLSDNWIHYASNGYRCVARYIEYHINEPTADDPGVPGKWFMAPETVEPLRQVILRKNEFFFHRSRPANMAYIFGFRKGEQGRNAVEIPQFDPLIAAEEKKIFELCKHLNDTSFIPGPELQPAKLRERAAAAKFTPQPHPEFTVAEGFEITLWAENPFLHKPIQINFDPQGRLWVASSEVYPQVEPGEAAHDKIIVLEDTTGAGKADKATVFADGLLIPTGVIPGDGGCYVAQSTELLHFKQTDPKKFVGDQRRIVLSSFGTEDTHHNLHTLRWGPDGRLWMNQSIYTRSEVETPHGVVRLRSGGIFRFEPATQKLEVMFKGWCNPWGHQFDEFGQSFVTDGAGFKGVSWGVPGAMYFTYAKMRREMQSVSPGNYPKFASLEIIRSTHFPADWQGRVVTCDFRANRVTSFSITEQGAGYITKQEADICRTSNNTFRPIDVKLGPDGALYIADWSNPIINHGEVDFRDPRRDREHGRIWRVSVKGRKLNEKMSAPDATLVKAAQRDADQKGERQLAVEMLIIAWLQRAAGPDSFGRDQSRRVLMDIGRETVAKTLQRWTDVQIENVRNPQRMPKTLGMLERENTTTVARMDAKKPTTELDLLNLLWVHQALGISNPELLDQLLAAQDGRIRAAAVRVLAGEL